MSTATSQNRANNAPSSGELPSLQTQQTHAAVAQLVAELLPQGGKVLDLGCGDGALLAQLQTRGCTGYGVDIDDANILACVQKGVPVLQLNLDDGLSMFGDQSFDVVLQINTLQNLRHVAHMLRETVRVGKRGVVVFPNFAHWLNRVSIARGRMPVTKELPYAWHDTPNIRVGTFADFVQLAEQNKVRIHRAFGLQGGTTVHTLPNWRASTAVFVVSR